MTRQATGGTMEMVSVCQDKCVACKGSIRCHLQGQLRERLQSVLSCLDQHQLEQPATEESWVLAAEQTWLPKTDTADLHPGAGSSQHLLQDIADWSLSHRPWTTNTDTAM